MPPLANSGQLMQRLHHRGGALGAGTRMMNGNELQNIKITQRSNSHYLSRQRSELRQHAEKLNGFEQSRRQNSGAISINDSREGAGLRLQ
jgi:hypothetical protein